MPPTHNPFRFEAAILSRMRSPVTSRSNWAKDSSTFRVSRPIEVVVLNCWVTETNETECWSNSSTSLHRSPQEFDVGLLVAVAGEFHRLSTGLQADRFDRARSTRSSAR